MRVEANRESRFQRGLPWWPTTRGTELGIFRKNKTEPQVQPFIGRKFRSSLTVDECLANYRVARDQCYQVVDEFEPVWSPPDPGTYVSSQGGQLTGPPSRVLANTLAAGGVIQLAVWDGAVAGGGGTQMWFVPPGFDQSPIPLAGTWKMRDSSLSSVGWVEGPLWGL